MSSPCAVVRSHSAPSCSKSEVRAPQLRERALDQPLPIQLGLGGHTSNRTPKAQIVVLLRLWRRQAIERQRRTPSSAGRSAKARPSRSSVAAAARPGTRRDSRCSGIVPARPTCCCTRAQSDCPSRRSGSGVVDVELAGDLVAGPREQRGDPVAERGAAPVRHVQRPGGIGRHELDVDLHPPPGCGPAVVGPLGQHLSEDPDPLIGLEKKIDEPGTCNVDLRTRPAGSSAGNSLTSVSATARGGCFSGLASMSARFVARSPWEGSRVAVTSGWTSSDALIRCAASTSA